MKRLELLLFASLVVALKMVAQPTVYSLEFNPDKYIVQTYTFDDKEYQVRAFENIIYVANPVDTVYQKMNIYVPEEYFHGKTLGRYDRESAPIFLPNGIGGYMPSGPMTLSNQSARNIFGQREGGRQGRSGRPQGMPQPPAGADMKQGSAIHYALAHGYVVASPGARGRSLQNSAGVFTGKAPAGLVDLKAAIRYLKYNDKHIPGNKERIISNGTSAGGAMSTLLGATGNSNDYAPYLLELGAAKATDNILAVSAYCPITNLNHADCAYEWQFNGINTYEAGMMRFLEGTNSNAPTSNELTPLQIKTSNEL